MITFLIGLCMLIAGAAVYGRICEKTLAPTDDKTPAEARFDGVDYVPMNKWRNSLIQLLNIAGTGPVLGPIQGVLFGPVAFITIPIGCVLGGAFHDYMIGMISARNDGEQMPGLIRLFLGKHMYRFYTLFVCLTLLLVGAVFIYTPGDLFVTGILRGESTVDNPYTWVVYGVIFVYCIIATLLPIDKIIGKVYPLFGGILLLSAVGVFVGLFTGHYELTELWQSRDWFFNPFGERFIPIFFVTVACGIVSGFHSTQTPLVSRTIQNEHHGRLVFYDMMIAEGFIAMVWAAAAMAMVNGNLAAAEMLHNAPASVVGIVARHMLGNVGGMIALIGVIILPVTSADTALRALRVMAEDAFNIDKTNRKNNILLAVPIFSVVAAILYFAKSDAEGFNVMWRYFAWANECMAVFSFTLICIYMMKNSKPYVMALIPGAFYMYVCTCYILSAKIGFGLPWGSSYIIAGLITLAYGSWILYSGKRARREAAEGSVS